MRGVDIEDPKKGFTLIELLVVMTLMFLLLWLAVNIIMREDKPKGTGAINRNVLRASQEEKPQAFLGSSRYEEKINQASKIEIVEESTLFSKLYNLYVNGEKVASVSGKSARLFSGDIFTLKTVDGKVLASEEECVRFFTLDRAAICYGPDGRISGYLGEDQEANFFSLAYVFYFYDADKRQLGKSEKIGKILFNQHKLYDNQGNEDYDIDKQAGLFSDSYTLTRKDFDSSIPLYYAIFIVCIEDAIGDAN